MQNKKHNNTLHTKHNARHITIRGIIIRGTILGIVRGIVIGVIIIGTIRSTMIGI